MRRVAAVAMFVSGSAGAAWAQPSTMPPEPDTPARLQLGPLGVRPALIVRDVGYDSNVLNQNGEGQGDFTATVGAKVDLGMRVARVVTNYSSFYEYLYFADFPGERGSNRGAEGRADFLLGRLRPYVTAGIRSAHERPTAEIDARALRQQTSFGVGTAAAVASRTTARLEYRRAGVDYADDERFRGVRLAEELDSDADALLYGMDFELSPFTTVSVHGERATERFEFSPDRDADSQRYGMTVALQPQALISGRATVGVRAFRPLDAAVPDFTGVTAGVQVGYAFRDRSRVTLSIDRDVRQSLVETTPYYLSTGVRAIFTQRIVRNLDAQLTGGFERLAYQRRDDAPPADPPRDGERTLGAGLGVWLNEETRLGINFDHTTRTSPVPAREYTRGRLFTSLTYGF